MVTTIQVDESLKGRLDALKIHHRETYNELLVRLLEQQRTKQVDKESLIETIDILSDQKTMRELIEALEDYQKGNFVELE